MSLTGNWYAVGGEQDDDIVSGKERGRARKVRNVKIKVQTLMDKTGLVRLSSGFSLDHGGLSV